MFVDLWWEAKFVHVNTFIIIILVKYVKLLQKEVMNTYTIVVETKFVFFRSKHLLVLFSDLFFTLAFQRVVWSGDYYNMDESLSQFSKVSFVSFFFPNPFIYSRLVTSFLKTHS